ncbi:MAG TPA: TrmH family RNA methyltransferase, partial [Candidatus Cloacimonetes bacterium]|nr:TrmH family RNA methyltransferase [Candidatus Cloacimonadota bacterium]
NYSDNEELTKISGLINIQMDLRKFLSITVPLEHKIGSNLKDNDFLILQKDGEKPEKKKIPLYLILDNLRSSFNVGSIFRTAECFGVSEILLCGYTATPENKKVRKTAMGTDKIVKWKYFERTEKAIEFLKNRNIKIYALETTSNAKPINEIEIPKSIALIFGNEALGISKEILRLTDKIVQIPLSGWKNSLNVGVTAGICCYEVSRQWGK